MFCINCGTQLDDRSKFCPYCGADLSCVPSSEPNEDQQTVYQTEYQYTPRQPVQQPQYQPPKQQYQPPVQPPYQPVAYQPMSSHTAAPKKKKRKKGLAIGLTVFFVLLLAAAAAFMFVTGVFAGPNVKVGNAITKSADAYVKAAKFLPDIDLSGLKESKSYSADLTAKLMEINIDSYEYADMLTMLEGASVNISNDFHLEERDFSLSVSPALGSAKLLTAKAALRDNYFYAACPDILGDTVYGADTETIGKDLQNLGATVDGLEDIGFNVFDIIEELRPLLEELKFTDEEKDTLKAAALSMFAEAEIEKVGKDEVDVNGTDIECEEYFVVIPEDAVADLFDVLQDILRETDYEDLAEEIAQILLSSVCHNKETVDEIMSDMDFSELNNTNAAFDAIEDVLKELEDLEFTLYLKDGYVMSVFWEDSLYDTDFEVTADFGGDGEYADTLGLEAVINDDLTVTLESVGDHSARDGSFTDESSIEVEFDGDSIKVGFETEYDPESGEFSVNFGAMGMLDVTIEGIFTGGENTLELTLDKVAVEAMGEKVITAGLSFTLGTYEKRVSMSDPVLISTLTEDDLLEIAEEIESQAYSWALDLVAEYPELLEFVL